MTYARAGEKERKKEKRKEKEKKRNVRHHQQKPKNKHKKKQTNKKQDTHVQNPHSFVLVFGCVWKENIQQTKRRTTTKERKNRQHGGGTHTHTRINNYVETCLVAIDLKLDDSSCR